jgi:hypothetical protein
MIDVSRGLALDDIFCLERAFLDADAVVEDRNDIGRLGSIVNVSDHQLRVIFKALSVSTDVLIAINWSNQFPRGTCRVTIAGGNEHTDKDGKEENAAQNVRAAAGSLDRRLVDVNCLEIDILDMLRAFLRQLGVVEVFGDSTHPSLRLITSF